MAMEASKAMVKLQNCSTKNARMEKSGLLPLDKGWFISSVRQDSQARLCREAEVRDFSIRAFFVEQFWRLDHCLLASIAMGLRGTRERAYNSRGT